QGDNSIARYFLSGKSKLRHVRYRAQSVGFGLRGFRRNRCIFFSYVLKNQAANVSTAAWSGLRQGAQFRGAPQPYKQPY
ncbi:MAG: hypothetical protein O9353_08695, partial [Bacteroidia bacterium]|nr:hypothetical protein [Bacteroidia bacterium]